MPSVKRNRLCSSRIVSGVPDSPMPTAHNSRRPMRPWNNGRCSVRTSTPMPATTMANCSARRTTPSKRCNASSTPLIPTPAITTSSDACIAIWAPSAIWLPNILFLTICTPNPQTCSYGMETA